MTSPDSREEVFACQITDMSMCGGPTEVEPEVGQEWMNVEHGNRLPVFKITERGLVLGSDSYQEHLTREQLWAHWVLLPDPRPPDNVTDLASKRTLP